MYRLVDCACLYKDLDFKSDIPPEKLHPFPVKQRLCKTILSLAPTAFMRQLLWSKTLKSCKTCPPDSITSRHVQAVWDKIKSKQQETESNAQIKPQTIAEVLNYQAKKKSQIRKKPNLIRNYPKSLFSKLSNYQEVGCFPDSYALRTSSDPASLATSDLINDAIKAIEDHENSQKAKYSQSEDNLLNIFYSSECSLE